MRTLTIAMILSIGGVALTACSTVEKTIGGVQLSCPRVPEGIIRVRAGGLSINSLKIAVCRDETVTLRLVGQPLAVDDASTHPKHPQTDCPMGNADTCWLHASNNPDTKKITIHAPPAPPTNPNGDEYEYSIEVKGVGQLDPRIVVQ